MLCRSAKLDVMPLCGWDEPHAALVSSGALLLLRGPEILMGICKSNVEGISPEDIIVGDCALSYERSRWIIGRGWHHSL